MRKTLVIAATGTGVLAAPAAANDIQLSVEIPRLRVSEYHNPYVAIWIEDANDRVAANLDVWYDVDLRGEDGAKWLSDLRTWWRRSGRSLSLPADGISGPTQAPGTHTVRFSEGSRPLGRLAAGSYSLKVEAAREVGGRETVSIPFQWPPRRSQTATASGSSELGDVRLTIAP